MEFEMTQMDYDYILEHRIKQGKYCLVNSLFSLLLSCNSGLQIATLSVIVPVIDKDFQMNKAEKVLIAQTVFIGQFIAIATGGYLGDKYGRKKVFQYSNIFCIVLAYLSSYSESAIQYIIIRILVGACIGIIAVNNYSYLSEVSFKGYQQTNVGLYNLFVYFGMLIFTVLASLCLETIDQGDWRYLIKLSNLIISVTIVLNYFQSESIKYQLEKGKYDEAFLNIDQAIKSNDSKAELLSDYEKEQLRNHYIQKAEQQQQQQVQVADDGYWAVLQSEYLRSILFVAILWHVSSLSYYSEIWMIPVQIHEDFKNNVAMSKVILGSCYVIDLIFTSITVLIITKKSIGVVQMFYIAQISRFIFMAVGLFVPYKTFIFLITKPLSDAAYNMVIIYAAELFPTSIKARSLGIGSMAGKLGGILMPLVMYCMIDFETEYFICYNMIMIVLMMTIQSQFSKQPNQQSYSELQE